MDFAYKFPVVKGRQAGRPYYIAMVPLKMLSRLFQGEEDYVPPEYRAQRKLNESRIPEIKEYILGNSDNYVFSALAASIDGDTEFVDGGIKGLGTLEVSMDSRFLINDGQHRVAAILEAIAASPELGDETISIVLYGDEGLQRSQQMFTDLNKHAVRTSNSISELYDSRDEMAVATRKIVSRVPFLDRYIDKEKDNLGKFSSSLFTLNSFYKANVKALSGREISETVLNTLVIFWTLVCENMVPWIELQEGSLKKLELRECSITTQSVLIQALGRVGCKMMDMSKAEMASYLSLLRKIDWNRSAPMWKLRVVNIDGKIIGKSTGIILAANAIQQSIGLALNDDESSKEAKFRQTTGKE